MTWTQTTNLNRLRIDEGNSAQKNRKERVENNHDISTAEKQHTTQENIDALTPIDLVIFPEEEGYDSHHDEVGQSIISEHATSSTAKKHRKS